ILAKTLDFTYSYQYIFFYILEATESRIKASDTNLRTERNHAQKRFKGGLRADFNNRISASRTLKQLTMATEPKQPYKPIEH
ncbi:hypothetical protein ACR9KP_07905, partial [Helicobacter pylori]